MQTKSNRLRAADLRRIFLLLNECRELGDDVTVWRTHLLKQIAHFVGADIGMGGEMSGIVSGSLVGLGVLEYGWDMGFVRKYWDEGLEAFYKNELPDPSFASYLQACHGSRSGHRLADVLGARGWYNCPTYHVLFDPTGVDENFYSFCPLQREGETSEGLILVRAAGRRAFNEREMAIVHEIQHELAMLVGGPLARFTEPSPTDLPQRPREVLRLLLEGEGDKQIALHMGIGTHTVNQYTKLIYQHFGVSSRAELLARWIRRGWNAKATWASSTTASQTKRS